MVVKAKCMDWSRCYCHAGVVIGEGGVYYSMFLSQRTYPQWHLLADAL